MGTLSCRSASDTRCFIAKESGCHQQSVAQKKAPHRIGALERPKRIELLITRVRFPAG